MRFFLLNFIEPILVGETNNASMFPRFGRENNWYKLFVAYKSIKTSILSRLVGSDTWQNKGKTTRLLSRLLRVSHRPSCFQQHGRHGSTPFSSSIDSKQM